MLVKSTGNSAGNPISKCSVNRRCCRPLTGWSFQQVLNAWSPIHVPVHRLVLSVNSFCCTPLVKRPVHFYHPRFSRGNWSSGRWSYLSEVTQTVNGWVEIHLQPDFKACALPAGSHQLSGWVGGGTLRVRHFGSWKSLQGGSLFQAEGRMCA